MKKRPIALGSFRRCCWRPPSARGYGEAVARGWRRRECKRRARHDSVMIAIATDRPNPATVKLLLNRGADGTLKSNNGESVCGLGQK